jgi:hypothetical protein
VRDQRDAIRRVLAVVEHPDGCPLCDSEDDDGA